MRYEIVLFRDIRKDDVLVRYIAGKHQSIGKVFMVQQAPRGGVITLITDEGHRVVGKPDQLVTRGKA